MFPIIFLLLQSKESVYLLTSVVENDSSASVFQTESFLALIIQED